MERKSRINIKDLLSTIIVLVLFVGIFFIGHFAMNEISQLKSQNKLISNENENLKQEIDILKSTNTTLLQEKNELNIQIGAINQKQKEEELIENGINTQKVNIKKLEIKESWVVSTFNYQLEAVYLTPVISNVVSDESIADMHFLMVEVKVKDNRSIGNTVKIPVNDYVVLVDGNLTIDPFTSENDTISPQEEKSIFVGFPVTPLNEQFLLRVGLSASSKDIDVDFEDELTEDLFGVFIQGEGYAPEYVY